MYRTKQEYVYEKLREAIQTGDLPPGTGLTNSALAQNFGVSSIPVREALRQLADEGFVDIQPHTRVVVRGVSQEDALWVGEMRMYLEPKAARSATPHVTKEALLELEGLLVEMDRLVEEGDQKAYSKTNRLYHQTIYGFCPNRRLHSSIDDLWETSQRFAITVGLPNQIHQGQIEHKRILTALKGGDPDEVENTVYEHRLRVLETIQNWLKDRQKD